MSRRGAGANFIADNTKNKKHARPDCPLCGSTMRLKETQQVVRVPGNPSDTTRNTAEWVCPDCDYFEEAEGD